MSKLKKGDTIRSQSLDEAKVYMKGLREEAQMSDAKKNKIILMNDEELADHYYDMAHLPLTSETKDHDWAFFHAVVMEMAARFARNVVEQKEAADE